MKHDGWLDVVVQVLPMVFASAWAISLALRITPRELKQPRVKLPKARVVRR